MFSEFKSFVARSNVLKLAVAVITGNAFGSIVTALTGDILMPLILGQIYGSSGCGFAGSICRGEDHATTARQSAVETVRWIDDRFAGIRVANNCGKF